MFQTDLLKGKRILITGGGTGPRLLHGPALPGAGRRAGDLRPARARCWPRPRPSSARETGRQGRDPGLRRARCRGGRADGRGDLGRGAAGSPWSTMPPAISSPAARSCRPRAIDAVLGIVLHGSAYCTTGLRPALAGGAAIRPRVLSIITTYAWTGSAYVVPSAMAKAGVLAMTRSLAVEWGGRACASMPSHPGPFPRRGPGSGWCRGPSSPRSSRPRIR